MKKKYTHPSIIVESFRVETVMQVGSQEQAFGQDPIEPKVDEDKLNTDIVYNPWGE